MRRRVNQYPLSRRMNQYLLIGMINQNPLKWKKEKEDEPVPTEWKNEEENESHDNIPLARLVNYKVVPWSRRIKQYPFIRRMKQHILNSRLKHNPLNGRINQTPLSRKMNWCQLSWGWRKGLTSTVFSGRTTAHWAMDE